MKDNNKKDDDILKDGERLVVKLAMMDSTNNLNRPGYRKPAARDAASFNADRENAYREYHDRQTNAWRGRDDTLPITGAGTHNLRGEVGNHHPPYGAYPYRPELVGTACTIDGWDGRLSEVNIAGERWLVCKPTSSDADFPRRKIKRNRFNQEEGEEELEKDKATLDRDREAAYRDYDLALASSWRVGK